MNPPATPHQPFSAASQIQRPAPPATSATKPIAQSAESSIPLWEANLRLLQALETYAKETWVPELEEKVKKLKDHSDERKRLDEKEVALSLREEHADDASAKLATEKETLEQTRRKVDEDAKTIETKKIEIEQLDKSLRAAVTTLTTGATATLPTAFRGEFASANIKEWLTLPAPQPLGIRLHVFLQVLGIAEDIKSKELFLTVGAECYRAVSDIDKALQNKASMTKKLAESLSVKNEFGYKFRIPIEGQPIEPVWMTGPAGVVKEVECWAILDAANNGKKALVR